MVHPVSRALAAAALAILATTAGAAERTLPPVAAKADYQLGGAYPPPAGVRVVVRDWHDARPLPGRRYSVCYVNAFQTQPDDDGSDRPDETSNWPQHLVLRDLEDPNWPGEFLIDLSSAGKRRDAVRHVSAMIATCARKGFTAVEFDNLDSWMRFDGTPLEDDVPFDRADTVAYARLLVRAAHDLGLAAAQKNTPEFDRRTAKAVIGFDFAIVEDCGRFRECDAYTRVHGRRVIDIEYSDAGFERACATLAGRISIVRRDLDLKRPTQAGYRYQSC